MKYTYAYKTSDGTRHVEAKDNGEIRGFRLRTVIAVGVIAAVLGFVLGAFVVGV